MNKVWFRCFCGSLYSVRINLWKVLAYQLLLEVFSEKEICFICLPVFFDNLINLLHLFICFTQGVGRRRKGSNCTLFEGKKLKRWNLSRVWKARIFLSSCHVSLQNNLHFILIKEMAYLSKVLGRKSRIKYFTSQKLIFYFSLVYLYVIQ